MRLISYRKTVVGWFNFDTEAGMTYNVNPQIFREITGVSEKAVLGSVELSKEEYEALMAQARLIKLPEGFEWVS